MSRKMGEIFMEFIETLWCHQLAWGFLAGKSSNLIVDVQFTEFHIWDPGQCTSWFPMGFCAENPLLSRISLGKITGQPYFLNSPGW